VFSSSLTFIQELRTPQFYHPVLIIKKPSCWWTLGCIGLLRLYKEMRETHLTLDLLAIRPLLFMRDRLFDLLPSQLNLGEKQRVCVGNGFERDSKNQFMILLGSFMGTKCFFSMIYYGGCLTNKMVWLVVSTPPKNISQLG
jgi:hypothetical protein